MSELGGGGYDIGSEFPRSFDVRQCDGKPVHVVAKDTERAALARRFGLVRINRLEAQLLLSRRGRTVDAAGRLSADIVQSCAVSAEDLPVDVREDIFFRFVPKARLDTAGEEIELDADACDEIGYTGTHFDLGEAVAQSLALAIDPFAIGPEADEARNRPEMNDTDNLGPFAALKSLGL